MNKMLLSARKSKTATRAMKHDNWQTPAEVFTPLFRVINVPAKAVIEDPFYGDGSSGKHLRRATKGSHRVIHHRKEFFSNPLSKADYEITCGPFSFTEDIVKRFMEKKKPFALLVRSTILHQPWFHEAFAEKSYQFLPVPGKPAGLPFHVGWLIYDIPMRIRVSACMLLRHP